jgi:oxaloacetate decarboxylase (Na+ extruding) subunit alpha
MKKDTSGKEKQTKTPLRITDTTLRDAHQSLWATRMKIDDILKIIDVIDSVGYYSLEMWGGATFDVCLRFLRENPWERLRKIKAMAKNTPLQMLLRGQNILGYKNYPDDLLDRFIALSCYNGIDIFRVFDALNDVRNLEYAIKSIKKHGGHAQGTLSYTISPLHTVENYVKCAVEQVELGIDTLCIKDMAGILSPIAAKELVSALIQKIDVPIQIHCHATSGMAVATYYEGVKAGAGAIDCAISPLSGTSSQPPVETMIAIFRETEYATNIDLDALEIVEKYFKELSLKMSPGNTPTSPIDPGILRHQIPGGMISNLRSQLQQQNSLDKLDEVLNEVPRVRSDLGYPPLVTPTSQIVGTQAVLNTITGERYKIIPNEVKNYVKGLYGRPPGKIDSALMKQILGKEKPVTHRPADDLEPMLPKAAENLDSTLIQHEEDIISYCLFPEQALEYFKWRKLPVNERPPAPVDIELNTALTAVSADKSDKAAPSYNQALPNQEPFLHTEDYSGLKDVMRSVVDLNINELYIRRGDTSVSVKADAILTANTKFDSYFAPGAKPEEIRPSSGGKISLPEMPSQEKAKHEVAGETIKSPLSGNFYSAPSPGKPRFVNLNEEVKSGQTVCIVEAMKLINEIAAPFGCRVIKFLVEDGERVEKDQPIALIEKL